MDLFETNTSDLNFDQLNEAEISIVKSKLENLKEGEEILTEEVSTSQAYNFFNQFEEVGGL